MILAFKSLKRVSQVKNGGGEGGIADSDYLVKKKKPGCQDTQNYQNNQTGISAT